MAIHFLIPLAYRNIENLLFCEKEGIDQFPLFEKEGTGQFPSSGKRGNWSIPIIWKKRELRMLLFHFSPYYNVIGVAMARRYWIIPSSSLGKKIPHSRLRRSWGIHFFHLGIRREFANTSSPSSSHYLITL